MTATLLSSFPIFHGPSHHAINQAAKSDSANISAEEEEYLRRVAEQWRTGVEAKISPGGSKKMLMDLDNADLPDSADAAQSRA